MNKYVFYTLGCRANQYQSSALECQMTNVKYQMRKFGEEADIYVINTCTVTADADRKSRQAIRRALRLAKKVIVTGCYAKLNRDYLEKAFPEVEFQFPSYLIPHTSSRNPKIRANLMIEDGCENFCSYCIVPFARGKVQTRSLPEIRREAEMLVKAGAREIVLTGINLGAWGDLRPILDSLCSIPKLLRIRLSSLEHQYLAPELIEFIAENPKICRHLHLPLQSGDNKILKLMNRRYTAEEYLKLVERIRRELPDCGITTDVIAGFPGEGEEEFQNTVNLINEVKFSRLHIFPYSARDLTAASKLPNQIDPKVKKQRFQVLDRIRKAQMNSFAEKYLGKEVEILVEQKGEGLTANYIRVVFDDPQDLSGKLHKLNLSLSHLKS